MHSEVAPCWMNEIDLWPFGLSSLGLCQPCILAAGPPSYLFGRQKMLDVRVSGGRGWVCTALLLGQRYGSGISKSPARFYCESVQGAQGGLLLLTQVPHAGEIRPAHFLIFSNFLPTTSHFFLCCVHSLSWRTRRLPSAAASLSDCWH